MKMSRYSRKSMKKGGMGAAAYMESVAGGPVSQVGTNGAGGVLQYHAAPCMSGGSKRKNGNKRGGTMFADLAVPAVLLYANQTLRKSSSNKSRFNRRRSNRRRSNSRR